MDRQFLLTAPFIFPAPLLVPYRAAPFMTSLSTVLHCQPLLWRILLLVLGILLKNKELRREGGIPGLLEVTVTVGYPMEGDASRKPFGFAVAVLGSTRRPTNVKSWP